MIIRKNELIKMSDKDIDQKIIELRKELMKSRAKSASGVPPENPGKVKHIRKTIAMMLTMKKQRGLKE
jgi:large subunit ribosomal protein L29